MKNINNKDNLNEHSIEYEIGYCYKCIQSTNHLKDVCQKCLSKDETSSLKEKILKRFDEKFPRIQAIFPDKNGDCDYESCEEEVKSFILDTCLPMAREQARREAVKDCINVIETFYPEVGKIDEDSRVIQNLIK